MFHDESDREAQKFIDFVNALNLKQHINFPTHQQGHMLDLIFTHVPDELVFNVSATHYLSSDHAALKCSLGIGKPDAVKMEIQFRKLHEIDIDIFRNDIMESNLL